MGGFGGESEQFSVGGRGGELFVGVVDWGAGGCWGCVGGRGRVETDGALFDHEEAHLVVEIERTGLRIGGGSGRRLDAVFGHCCD